MTEKVVSINSHKSKKKDGSSDAKKSDVIIELSKILHPEQNFKGISLRKLDFDVRLIQDTKGGRRWVKVSADRVVTIIDPEAIAFKLAASVFGIFPDVFDLSSKDLKEIMTIAMHIGEHYDEVSEGEKLIILENDIVPVLFKSSPGWTWHRLPYDPDASDLESKEYWETEMFPRFKKNFKPFMAWCGSLFDPNSPRVLCPWLYGEGASGKGTLAMFLMQCMGDAGTTVDPEHLSFDKFALESLEGKRFAFVDETPSKLPTSAKFKRMTGERIQLVNRKSIKAVPMRVDVKFMFASNHFPTIKSGKEFARRIMPVPFEAIDGVIERNKEEVIKLMHKHAAYFWGIAMEEYNKNRELADYDVSEILEYQEDISEIIDMWIQRNMTVSHGSFFPVRLAIDGAGRDRLDWYTVRKHLREKYNVKCEPRKVKGVSFMCLLGYSWIGCQNASNFVEKEEEIDF
jgi:hypothetical protein